MTSRIGILFLCASLPLSGCVCESGRKAPPEPKRGRELCFYDFTRPAAPELLSLWPASPDGPRRHQRHLVGSTQGRDLVLSTLGPDPYLVWEFESPVRAGALSVDVQSDRAGMLQLFWTAHDCKVYEERCSMTRALSEGRQRVDFVLDPERPLSGVRLDFPEQAGTNLILRGVSFGAEPRLRGEPVGRESSTELSSTPEGLRVVAKSRDPWLVFATPGLDTAEVESVELRLRAPRSAPPQLFWRGTGCAEFSESCQVRFQRVPGEPDAYSARPRSAQHWTGMAREIRLDPGEEPGVYLVERLAFVRRAGK